MNVLQKFNDKNTLGILIFHARGLNKITDYFHYRIDFYGSYIFENDEYLQRSDIEASNHPCHKFVQSML